MRDPQGICLDKEGNLLVADSGNNCIRKINISNGMVTTIAGDGKSGIRGYKDGNSLSEAQFYVPSSLALYNDIIYVADTENNAIRKIHNGIVSTIATGFKSYGITIDNNGNILVADYGNNCIKRIDENGNIYTFPRSMKHPRGIKVDSDGKIYVCTDDGIIA